MSGRRLAIIAAAVAACAIARPCLAQPPVHALELPSMWTQPEPSNQGPPDWSDLGIEVPANVHDALELYDDLTSDDAAFEPDYNPPGMPQVPISCGEDEACQECYAKAQNELNFLRVQFEKLRAIYDSTKKMSDNAISFGDDVSSIHGVMGLSWQMQKRGIQKSVEHLGQTYDKKYTDLLSALERQLKKLAECEAKHFNSPDWYNRFGFIYYQFMAARYKR
jgi:hypothetical protein